MNQICSAKSLRLGVSLQRGPFSFHRDSAAADSDPATCRLAADLIENSIRRSRVMYKRLTRLFASHWVEQPVLNPVDAFIYEIQNSQKVVEIVIKQVTSGKIFSFDPARRRRAATSISKCRSTLFHGK